MYSYASTSNSAKTDLGGQSSSSNKSQKSGNGDFLAELLSSIKSQNSAKTAESSSTSTQNYSQNSSFTNTQNSSSNQAQNTQNTQNSSLQNNSQNTTNSSENSSFSENSANSQNSTSLSNENTERLEVDDATIAQEEGKSATLEDMSEPVLDENGKPMIDENGNVITKASLANSQNAQNSVITHNPALEDEGFVQILEVLEAISGGQTPKFARISNALEKIISTEANLNDLKNVKDLKDLIKIAEKLELNLGKLTITSDDVKVLKTKLPTLQKSNFFEGIDVSLNKAAITAKTAKAAPAPVSLESLLSGKTKPQPIQAVLTSAALHDKTAQKPKEQTGLKGILTDDFIAKKTGKNTSDIKINEPKKDIKNSPKADVKESIKTPPNDAVIKPKSDPLKDALSVAKAPNKPVDMTPKAAPKVAKESPKISKEELKSKLSKYDKLRPEAEVVKAEKETPKAALDLPKVAVKNDDLKGFDINNYLNALSKKAATAIEESSAPALTNTESSDSAEAQNYNFGDAIENRLSHDTLKDMISAIRLQEKFVPKEIQLQSVRTFASEMVEKISEFKPPVTRVNLQLHPAELGEVNITMIARANNLHVNVTSTNNTMALFLQNQAEFKTSLVNMGFSEIQMSFNDNKEGQQGQQQRGKKAREAYEEDELSVNEIENANGSSTLEIVLPRYI